MLPIPRPLLAALALAAGLAACAEPVSVPAAPPAAPRTTAAAGTLQWFGYAAGSDDEPSLIGTDSYANWGEVITNDTATSTWAANRINALSAHGMKSVVELGRLLWDPLFGYNSLRGDWADRWNAWKQANAAALASGNVIAFIVRDEPFSEVDIPMYEQAAAMVKHDFPSTPILLIESAQEINCENVNESPCHFRQNAGLIHSVDWIGVDRYAIDPRTDASFRSAVDVVKLQWPGRKMVYVADGYWNQTHQDSTGLAAADMGQAMTWWYDVARADPSAVMIATFIWGPLDLGDVTSRDLPASALGEHIRVGREITGRGITHQYAATGSFNMDGTDGYVTGWACDPDGAWGETVTVKVYRDGVYFAQGPASLKDLGARSACRTGGLYHAFHVQGSAGHRMTATAVDLDGNEVPLATTCRDAPACVWYPILYQPTGLSALSVTGALTGWACDRDAPAVSINVLVRTSDGADVGTYAANVASEAAVNTQCGGGTAHRFSVQLPAATKGKTIYAYGVDTMAGMTLLPAQAGTGRVW
ncbi:MAG: hypothetical protein JO306_04165 [Gemmatimonadetes bacterium]|nr:hypothetical protein [Gemmatimonadota bacterium]